MPSINKFCFIFLLLLFSCNHQKIEIENFNEEIWKKDYNGCERNRVSIAKILYGQREKLLNKSEKEILSSLGKPDKNELYNRNQKFYIYSISPNENCTDNPQKGAYLQIRFNALGRSNEVLLINHSK